MIEAWNQPVKRLLPKCQHGCEEIGTYFCVRCHARTCEKHGTWVDESILCISCKAREEKKRETR